MARNCIASINLNAITNNYLYAKSLAPESRAIAVIKGNAYGHGAVKVASHLEPLADCFGVACIEEALELRSAGISRTPILLLEGAFEESELALVDHYELWMVVSNNLQIEWIQESSPINKYNIFVKIDTGMGRLGFKEDESPKIINGLENCDHINKITLMTHFSSADNHDSSFTEVQIDKFNNIVGNKQNDQSLANSAAIMAWNNSHSAYTRPGIMLYGLSPFQDKTAQDLGLKPAMALTSEIIALQVIKSGESVGYGSDFIAKQNMKIGVVACGYGDGYPRHAKKGTPVSVDGNLTCLVGRVSMDMLYVDLSSVPEAHIGSKVELWGESISVDSVAQFSGTVGYELVCAISASQRVPLRNINA